MTNRSKWGTPTLLNYLSAAINALPNGQASSGSTTIDNTSNEYVYCDIEIYIPFASGTPSASALVLVVINTAIDGTDFDTGFFDTNNNDLVVNIPIGQSAATPQRVVARNIPLPPSQFQISIGNWTGLDFPASGNTVNLLLYGYNLNG